MNKKTILFHSIIREYIKSNEPIGSEFLRLQLNSNIKMSSATIRNYCKILSEEGCIGQVHTSSGRVPTNAGLKMFWRECLDSIASSTMFASCDELSRINSEHKIYCIIRLLSNNRLEEVESFDNRYIVLKFEEGEIILTFSNAMHRFTTGMVGLSADDMYYIASTVKANELASKLNSLLEENARSKTYRFGSENLVSLLYDDGELFLNFLKGDLIFKFKNGVYFDVFVPDGYLAVINDIKCDDKDARMLCFGDLLQDYESFYTRFYT